MQELANTDKYTEINRQSDVKFWLHWINFGAVSYLSSCTTYWHSRIFRPSDGPVLCSMDLTYRQSTEYSNYVWSWLIQDSGSEEQSLDLLKEVAIYLKCKVPKRMCNIQNLKFEFQSTLSLPFTYLLLLLISTSN